MSDNKYKILLVSGYPPSRSANLAQDIIHSLEGEGHEVDFLTMYSFSGQKPNQYSIYPEPFREKLGRIKQRYPKLSFFKKIVQRLFPSPEEKANCAAKNGYIIHHLDESNPPLSNDILAEHLPNKHYDFIYIMIVQRMMTSSSFLTIYEKYKAPMILAAVDMLHLTGGCYFFGNCERFGKGCGMCPVLESCDPNDITHQNYLFKKNVFSKISHGLKCNLYQSKFALQSGLFDEEHVFVSTIIIDEEKFKPYDSIECRKMLGIPANKEFVILARYEKKLSRMKGYDHMANIINIFANKLTEEQRVKILFLMIGDVDKEYVSHLNLDTKFLGRVDVNGLIRCYNASSVFISTSIDDAGPSMVNQSIMCGTPVVSFSIGTALQVIRKGISGYMAPNFDDDIFADAIHKILSLDNDSYLHLRKTTREEALNLNSKSANAKRIVEIFQCIKNV